MYKRRLCGHFAGAGLSVASGYVDWKELLRNPAKKIGLDVDKETDLVALAQYIYNKDGSKQPLAELIKTVSYHVIILMRIMRF